MFTIAYRMLNDREMANDSLQDAFISVFKNLSQFKEKSTLGAWIKTIVVRTSLNYIRNEKKFNNDNSSISEFEETTTTSCLHTKNHLEEVILSLPTGYRTIFLLIEVEGYTHKEAAELSNITEGTSKSQLFYAKKELRKRLKEFQFND